MALTVAGGGLGRNPVMARLAGGDGVADEHERVKSYL